MADYLEMKKYFREYIEQKGTEQAMEDISAMIHCIIKDERLKTKEGEVNE